MRRLDGKVIVITGAGSGIGKATAELCAAEGARVIGLDVKGAERYCDVAHAVSVSAAFEDLDVVDGLVNSELILARGGFA